MFQCVSVLVTFMYTGAFFGVLLNFLRDIQTVLVCTGWCFWITSHEVAEPVEAPSLLRCSTLQFRCSSMLVIIFGHCMPMMFYMSSLESFLLLLFFFRAQCNNPNRQMTVFHVFGECPLFDVRPPIIIIITLFGP